MVEIEWIKIPAGNFLTGLSRAQQEYLREQVRDQYNFVSLDLALKRSITKGAQKIHQGYSGSPESEIASATLAGRAILKVENFLRTSPLLEEIWLKEFYIAKFPVTYQQFRQYLVEGNKISPFTWQNFAYESSYPSSHEPVFVSWTDAKAFCRSLGARLPTVEEWEKAARGTDERLYPWGNEWDLRRGNFTITDPNIITPVDRYPSGVSFYGLWDMAGNAYEWTSTPVVDPGLSSPSRYYELKSCFIQHEKYYGRGEPSNIPWLYNLIVYSGSAEDSPEGPNFGTGFRPVRDA
ncbi:MAG: SUMF1/EgtB/PvdO family nonheme iron enzyme [Chloroflexi bacterium]|nr:SUMF1/EgtB/PvdO family nonheme iron enzyme [Chloroflexota bacterium]